jgi:para-nitrobenzyl esterase
MLEGVERDGVAMFKGVPYAAPPVGELRFQAPRPFTRWSGVRTATAYGARALQSDDAWGVIAPGLAEIGTAGVEPQNESCLYLNVWTTTPITGAKRPVMVWLHGGAFITGSGGSPMYDGTSFAKHEGVVVVTLNHRLGSFGFLNLAELGGERFAASGSAGMLDIVAALAWVRDHIAAFGGDPHNVTVFGESGGGAKTSVLLAMPSAVGLFHKAIIQSGPAVEMMKPSDATAMARKVLAALDLGEPAALLDVPADKLLAAQRTALQSVASAPFSERRRVGFNPVIDGRHLPAGPFEPVAPSLTKHVPLMIGTNKDEMTLFLAGAPWLKELNEDGLVAAARRFVGERAESMVAQYRQAQPDALPRDIVTSLASDQSMRIPSLTMADRKVALRGAPVFVYLFTWETPVGAGRLKSTHALEIPFVFDTLAVSAPFVGTSPPHALAQLMRRTWAQFARRGTPNGEGFAAWPAYSTETRPTMVFGPTSRVANDPLGAERRAWD